MKTFLKHTMISALFMVLTVAISTAQYPRKVLVEFYSNTGCIPCLSANTFVDDLCTQYPEMVTCIKYHPYFPDPMDLFYVQNPAENDNRFQYYSMGAVPSYAMDGSHFVSVGSPSFQGVFLRSQLQSPFQLKTYFRIIDVPGTLNDSVYTTTVIKAGVNVTKDNLKLRIAVKEKYINASQGLFSGFKNVMRKFLPDTNGLELPGNFLAGDSIVITYADVLPSIYNYHNFAITAFIQDDNTKEVLQAADGIDDPVFFITLDNSIKPCKMVDASGMASFNFPCRIKTTGPADFKIALKPFGNNPTAWTQLISACGMSHSDSILLSFPAHTDSLITINLQASSGGFDCSQFNTDMSITNTSDTGSYLNFSKSSLNYFYITAYAKCTNVVFHQNASDVVISNALIATANNCLIITRQITEVDTVNFNKWSVRNLFLSYNFDTLRNELPIMRNLLNSGGNLFLEGSNIGIDVMASATPALVKSFYTGYMGTQYLSSMAPITTSLYPVFSDLYYGNVMQGTFAPNFYVSKITHHISAPQSTTILTYNNNASVFAGVRNTNGDFKTTLLGFHCMGLANQMITYQVIQSTISWFNGSATGLVTSGPASDRYTFFPNPADRKILIKIPATGSQRHIILFDLPGKTMVEQDIPANTTLLELNTSMFKNGIYTYVVMENEVRVQTGKIAVVRR